MCCRVPLQNLEARLALRSTRPAAETVEDEVQAAMASEAAQLKAVATQLHARVDAAGQQIAHLTSVSAALLRHIADKDTALTLEEKVALMDGRKIAAVPPSPTVLSVSVQNLFGACFLVPAYGVSRATCQHWGDSSCSIRSVCHTAALSVTPAVHLITLTHVHLTINIITCTRTTPCTPFCPSLTHHTFHIAAAAALLLLVLLLLLLLAGCQQCRVRVQWPRGLRIPGQRTAVSRQRGSISCQRASKRQQAQQAGAQLRRQCHQQRNHAGCSPGEGVGSG
jgi:hypothetical protein